MKSDFHHYHEKPKRSCLQERPVWAPDVVDQWSKIGLLHWPNHLERLEDGHGHCAQEQSHGDMAS